MGHMKIEICPKLSFGITSDIKSDQYAELLHPLTYNEVARVFEVDEAVIM